MAICYGKSARKPKRSLRIDGEYIRWETSVKYLRNIHCFPMTNCNDVTYKKRIYLSSVNKINCQFSFASSSTRAKLLQTCRSLGLEVKLAARYRSSSYRLKWGSQKNTTSKLLFSICRVNDWLPAKLNSLAGNPSFTRQIECRWLKFY